MIIFSTVAHKLFQINEETLEFRIYDPVANKILLQEDLIEEEIKNLSNLFGDLEVRLLMKKDK